MKKLLTLFLVLIMSLSLFCGCGGASLKNDDSDTTGSQTTETDEKDDEPNDETAHILHYLEEGKYEQAYYALLEHKDKAFAEKYLNRFLVLNGTVTQWNSEDQEKTTTSYEYDVDKNGNIRKKTAKRNDGSIETSEYEYDQNGTRTKGYFKNESEEWSVTYHYDNAGNLTEVRNGQDTTLYQYDAAGNCIKKRSGDEIYTYEYNSYGDCIKTTWEIVNIGEAWYSEEYTYQYSSDGKPLSQQRIQHTETGTNRQTTMYSYDSEGRIIENKTISDNGDTSSQKYEYNEYGLLIKSTYSTEGFSTTTEYSDYKIYYIPN